jgi:predicted RNA binding protein YcfA (HicA-like mRNA interferase family)
VKIPSLKLREVAELLERMGFVEVRQRGSRRQLRHPDGRLATVPFHPGHDISPILVRQIALEIGTTVPMILGAR